MNQNDFMGLRPKPFVPVGAPSMPRHAYCPIDLSKDAQALKAVDLTDAQAMEQYIEAYCRRQKAAIAYGGYLEARNLYQRSAHFNQQDPSTERTIHLGIDFWAAAGTPVVAAATGVVHSFQDNQGLGNYGPTILLSHEWAGGRFHTLYGHLSRASLEGLEAGQAIAAGQPIGALGVAAVNGDYAPHLHFQVILELGDWWGDYPGVCSAGEVDYYRANCPDPAWLLGL